MPQAVLIGQEGIGLPPQPPRLRRPRQSAPPAVAIGLHAAAVCVAVGLDVETDDARGLVLEALANGMIRTEGIPGDRKLYVEDLEALVRGMKGAAHA